MKDLKAWLLAVMALVGMAGTSGAATAAGADTFDASLPPLPPDHVLHVNLKAEDALVTIASGVRLHAWTFNGSVPGPFFHVRVGDTVVVHFENDGTMAHSIDFHAAEIDPAIAFRSIAPGQSLTFQFRPKYPGAFLYHCDTPPTLLHLGSGMYGAMIVEPQTPLPPAREFALVYSDFYIRKAGTAYVPDLGLMREDRPQYSAFNGRAFQYSDAPLHVKVGDRVRFYIVDAGPRRPLAFHMIGRPLDTVYPGAPTEGALHGVQTYLIPPGGGAIAEIDAQTAGRFPFVNHDVGHGDQGAFGILSVDG